MARLFISHSSADNAAAAALVQWLAELGWEDVFLDIDPERGLVAGQKWEQELKLAADRCEAVLCLISPAWLASKWCEHEFRFAKWLGKRIFGLIVDPVPLDQVPAEMTAEWQICELVGGDRLRAFQVEVLGRPAQVSFREAGLDLLRRGLERAGLDARSFPWPPRGEPNRVPYRGLKALEPQDAAIFFGRDAWIVRGLDKIRGLAERGVERMLVILGASGSGKSSFLRAGLWPRLLRDDLNFLPLPIVRPQTAVMSGSSGLAVALAGAFARLGEARPPGRIREALAEGTEGLGKLLRELSALAKRRHVALAEPPGDPVVLLPLDQAEELFNAEGGVEAAVFIDLVAGMLAPGEGSGPRLLVVATMQSDRLELLQNEARLEAVKRDLFDLPPIPPGEFKSVIEGPARRVAEAGGRLAIDPALIERLIADAQGADALPLLGFTLERLYADYGAEGRLGLAEYEAMGGVQGSIEAAVATALAEPGRVPAIPAEREAQFAAMRAAFIPWLARIDPESGAPMRRVALHDEIPEGSRAVVERLVAARLLVADRRDGADVIEIAHESLLRQWPALTAWLDADAADLTLSEGVERAAAEWQRNGRLDAWLDHRGERLAQADLLLVREDFRRRLGPDGAAYLAACHVRDDAERREKEAALVREAARLAEIAAAQGRTARLQRVGTAVLVIVVIVLGVGAGVLQSERQRNIQLVNSLAQREIALTERDRAIRAQQTASLVRSAMVQTSLADRSAAIRVAVYAARDASNTASVLEANAELARAVAQVEWQLLIGAPDHSGTTGAFSPDGSRVVTGSSNTTAQIWDATTGQNIVALIGHKDLVLNANFSPNGARIVTASSDKTARIWDASTGRELLQLRGHERPVLSAAFSPDGTRTITGSADGTARIWDASDGRELLLLRGHPNVVRSAFFSPDSLRIVTASDDNTARLWNAKTGKEIRIFGHQKSVLSATFSLDGKYIVTGSADDTARIWNTTTGHEILVLRGHEGSVLSVAFSPDGKYVLTASADKTARIWGATTGHEIRILRGHESPVSSGTFSPSGSSILTVSQDSTARIWSGKSKDHILGFPTEHRLNSAVFSPDGTRILIASQDKTARIWDISAERQSLVFSGHQDHVRSAVFSPDGTRVLTTADSDAARIWDAATGNPIASWQGCDIFLRNTAFSVDGNRIAIGCSDNSIRIGDIRNGREILALRGHGWWVNAAAFSPDGTRIVTGSFDNTVRIWDAITGQEIRLLRGHKGVVNSVEFSADGKRVLTSSDDMTARLWDAENGREVRTLREHTRGVNSAAFSPDGMHIVTASDDKTARLWDATTGREIVVLRGHEGGVASGSFSPDGMRIVTVSDDRTARIWDVHLEVMSESSLITEACTRKVLGSTLLSREEMRLIGEPEDKPPIDVCAGVE